MPLPQPFQLGPVAGLVTAGDDVHRLTTTGGAGGAMRRPVRNSATALRSSSLSEMACTCMRPYVMVVTMASGVSCRSASGPGACACWPAVACEWQLAQLAL